MSTGNISLDIKYIFISMMQEYFEQHYVYPWVKDVTQTKVIIVDKNAIDLGITIKRPTIVFSRGSFSFMKIGMNQKAYFVQPGQSRPEGLQGPEPSSSAYKNTTYNDMIRGGGTFTVITKDGLEAEALADEVMTVLYAFREELQSKGVHSVFSISMGEESIVKSNSDMEMTGISISFAFQKNVVVSRGESHYNILVTIDDEKEFESIGFRINRPDADTVIMTTAPATGGVVKATYVDGITLETIEDVVLVGDVDGVNKNFTIPDGGTVHGYYTIFNDYTLTTVEDA
jgi:hypothetical protein